MKVSTDGGGGDPLERLVTFGKYKEDMVTWEYVLADDPDYCQWVVDNVEHISDALRDALAEALDDVPGDPDDSRPGEWDWRWPHD